MQEDELGVLFLLILLSPVIFVLIRALYSQVQARTLEFMLTLIVATMPIGLILNTMQRAREITTRVHWEKFILVGMFPALILFGGSIWGLSAARRLHEQRTWPRLGLMALGWLAFPCMATPFICGAIIDDHWLEFVQIHIGVQIVIIIGSILIAFCPIRIAVLIERKCKQIDLKQM